MTAQTFIFVHDEQIVLDYIAAGKFAELPDVKYVFLGQRPTDRIKHLDNFVVARDLPNHIENLPNLVAWTGWFAVVANKLVTADIVNLFEYDVNIVGKWEQPMLNTAYFTCPNNEVWRNYNNIGSEVEIAKKYLGINTERFTDLPMTSNYTMTGLMLHMAVYSLIAGRGEGAINEEAPMAGHVLERYYSMLFASFQIQLGRLTHLYADSHGTQGRGDRYNEIKSQLL